MPMNSQPSPNDGAAVPSQLINLFTVSIVITSKNGNPAIEMRALTTNPDIIKQVISAAYHNQPVVVLPQFTNLVQSLNSCIQKGILVRDDAGQYFFTQDFENLTISNKAKP